MASFKFKRFSSIDNIQRTDLVQKMQLLNSEAFQGRWIATEKIHGSNYSLWINDLEFRCGKRTGLLAQDGGSFYGDHNVIPDLQPKMQRLLELCKKKKFVPGNPTVTVYGEIFGGRYPHADVEPVKGAKKVQNQVWYSPKNEFMAFSLVVRDEEHTRWISFIERHVLLLEVGIRHVPVIEIGTFEEVCKVSNEFHTQIPEIFGLPQIKDNICEGVVLEPTIPAFLPNGERIVLKNKNAKFTEKSHEKTSKSPKEVPPEVARLFTDLSLYITENRLRNVLSKIGPIEDQKKAFGMIIKPFGEDILEDFQKDFPEFKIMEKKNQKLVTKGMNTQTAALIRKNFIKILAGDF